MCYTYDKSKGGDTRELQSRMVPPQKTGSSHLNLRQILGKNSCSTKEQDQLITMEEDAANEATDE